MPDAVEQRGGGDHDLGVALGHPWSVTIAGDDPAAEQQPRQAQRDVRDDLDVDPRVVRQPEARGVDARAMCHQALTCGSALTASKSCSSLRLPRVGARMRIAGDRLGRRRRRGLGRAAAAGRPGRPPGAAWGSGASASSTRPGYSRPRSRLLQREACRRGTRSRAARVPSPAVNERAHAARRRRSCSTISAADVGGRRRPYISFEKPLSITSGTKPSANAARVGRRWPSLSSDVDVGRLAGGSACPEWLTTRPKSSWSPVAPATAEVRAGACQRSGPSSFVVVRGRSGPAPLPPGWP